MYSICTGVWDFIQHRSLNNVLNTLRDLGMDAGKCYYSLQKRIIEVNSLVHYVPFAAHSLNFLVTSSKLCCFFLGGKKRIWHSTAILLCAFRA